VANETDEFDREDNNITASRLLDAHHAVTGERDKEGFLDNCETCGAAAGWLEVPGADFGHSTQLDSEWARNWIAKHDAKGSA
jgi:hypothetical protein